MPRSFGWLVRAGVALASWASVTSACGAVVIQFTGVCTQGVPGTAIVLGQSCSGVIEVDPRATDFNPANPNFFLGIDGIDGFSMEAGGFALSGDNGAVLIFNNVGSDQAIFTVGSESFTRLEGVGGLTLLEASLWLVDPSTTLLVNDDLGAILDNNILGAFVQREVVLNFAEGSIEGKFEITSLGIVRACPGDVSGIGGTPDNLVNVDDLNAILGVWNTSVGVGSPLDLAGDDGFIDVDDLNVILGNWQAICAVP